MSDDPAGFETCVVCGKSAESDRAFSHLYHDGRRFAVCCPICSQLFQRAPDRFARGENPQTLLDELIENLKWKDSTKP